MTKIRGFYAYPDANIFIGPTIEAGVSDFNERSNDATVATWKELEVAGRFIANEVLATISAADFFLADISHLNFNVTF